MLNTRAAEEIEAALLSLPKDISTVIQYHYLLQYSFQEIREKMQLSISTVRNHHNRGIFLMAKYFNDHHFS